MSLQLLFLASAGSCLARGVFVGHSRAAWLVLGTGLAAAAAAPAALGLAFYPACALALTLLLRSQRVEFRGPLWLDGLSAALAVAAAHIAVVLGAAEAAAGSRPTVRLAYPALDLLLLAPLVTVLASTGWRPGRMWGVAGAGIGSLCVADSLSASASVTGNALVDGVAAIAWVAAAALLAVAPWQDHRLPLTGRLEGWRALTMPFVFTLASLGVLLAGSVRAVDPTALGLAAASLLVVVARIERGRRMILGTRHQATTDSLTGLANRRRLTEDLEDWLEERSHEASAVLILLDLDGFKRYNDTFGHPAGDALLARLGRNLGDAVGERGTAYRMGGDEFCVLADALAADEDAFGALAAAALHEQGERFQIDCSYGFVRLPVEAQSVSDALRLADERLYIHKDLRRAGPGGDQIRQELIRALNTSESRLGTRRGGVLQLAVAAGLELGLERDELMDLRQAAVLHDIGKVAIPTSILDKPSALTDEEWDFVRGHPVAGARMLSASPALAAVVQIVRSTHERFDGRGYPDGLSGEAIPLSARIIAACDAFDAMISERPYAPARSVEEAVAELLRCSGTQFDPAVVQAVVAAHAEARLTLVA